MKQGNTASYVYPAFWRNLKISCKEAEGCISDHEALNCPGLVRTRTSQLWNWCKKPAGEIITINNHHHPHTSNSTLGQEHPWGNVACGQPTVEQGHPRGTAAHGRPVPGHGHPWWNVARGGRTPGQGCPWGTAAHGRPVPEWVCSLWRASCSMDIHEGLQTTITCTPLEAGGSPLPDWRNCDGLDVTHRKRRLEKGQDRLCHMFLSFISVPLQRAENTCLALENSVILLLSYGFFMCAVYMLERNP